MSDVQLYHCVRCGADIPSSGFRLHSADCLECERRMASVDAAVVKLHAERKIAPQAK